MVGLSIGRRDQKKGTHGKNVHRWSKRGKRKLEGGGEARPDNGKRDWESILPSQKAGPPKGNAGNWKGGGEKVSMREARMEGFLEPRREK